jgi:hypothetical protein
MDMTALVSEREACRETCKQAYEQIKDLRAAHDLVWQEFKAQEKLWKAQEYEERAKRREQAAAERAAREAARAARLAEMAPEPFFKEITMCEQLSAYLSRFVAGNGTAGAGARDDKKDDAPVAAGIQGMKVFKRQDDDDDDLSRLFGPGGKKTKGKKGGSGSSAPSAVSESKLVHSLDMLEGFATLKISVPTSISTIPSTLDIVNQRKEDYLKKREAEKAKKESEQLDIEANGALTETQNVVMSQEADQSADPSLESPSNGSDIKAETTDEVSKATKPSKQLQKQLQKPPNLDDAMSWPAMGAGDATGKAGVQLQMNSSVSSVSVSIEVSETNAGVTLSISPQI